MGVLEWRTGSWSALGIVCNLHWVRQGLIYIDGCGSLHPWNKMKAGFENTKGSIIII
jgi:hypothetical protein